MEARFRLGQAVAETEMTAPHHVTDPERRGQQHEEQALAATGEPGDEWRGGSRSSSMQESRQAYVVGGGPAGLAAAAELRRRGMHPVILERGEHVGTSWRAGLRPAAVAHGARSSGLPGFAIPRQAGRWPSGTP